MDQRTSQAPVSNLLERLARMRLTWPLAIFAVLALLFGLALFSGDPVEAALRPVGRPAPQMSLPPLEGLSDGARSIAGFS